MGDAASIQHGRRRRFNRQMCVLRMLSAERAAPDAVEKDAPFCRLTLAWIVFNSGAILPLCLSARAAISSWASRGRKVSGAAVTTMASRLQSR